MSEPTPYEWGRHTQTVADLSHKIRNTQQVVTALSEEVQELREELARLKARAYATGSAVLVAVPAVAWLVEFTTG